MSHLDELMAEVAATQRGQLQHLGLEPELARRVEAATRPAPTRRVSMGLALAGLAIATAGVALWVSGSLRDNTERAAAPAPSGPPLAFVVSGLPGARAGHPGQVGEILEADANQPLAATFSDGSEVVVAAGARARVVALEAKGAAIALERGQVDVHVVHRAETHWQVTAGAYRVRVTGTRFAVLLNPSADGLTVQLTEGSVEVTGPGGAANVSAGQELRAGPGGFSFAPAPSTTTADEAPAKGVRRAEDGPAPGPSELPRVDAAVVPARSWRGLARRARYDEALAAAVAGDFSAACGGLSATDVMLLGDVARLAGDVTRAEQAYGRALARFPKLERPAFALGLVAFEARRDYRGAASWFTRYLREHPSGPLASEASGRLLESLQRAGETARARAVATTYLRQYPDGAHAALARSLAEAP